MAKYKSAAANFITDDQATLIGKTMEDLKKKHKTDTVSAQMLVNAAKAKRSPLHTLFEWDDQVAANEYRLIQARKYLACVEVVVIVDEEVSSTKAFHSVTVEVADEEAETGYASFAAVSKNPKLAAQVVDKALGEMDRWQKRYQQYEVLLSPIIEGVKQVKTAQKRRSRKKAS